MVRALHPPREFCVHPFLRPSSFGFLMGCDHNPKKKPVRAAERNIHPYAYSCRHTVQEDVAVNFRPAECKQMTRSELRDQLKMEPTDMEILLHLARNVKVGIPVPPADEAEAIIAELNAALDRLEDSHTLFGGGIEAVAFEHPGKRRRSALAHTIAAGGAVVDALKTVWRLGLARTNCKDCNQAHQRAEIHQ
jgi:hypothetical protein